MPRLSDLDRGRAVGLLDSGLGIKAVSRFFACNPQNSKTNYQQNIELLVRSKICQLQQDMSYKKTTRPVHNQSSHHKSHKNR